MAAADSQAQGARTPRFTELIPANPGIDFVALRGKAIAVSAVLIGIGFASIIARGGLNYGIDFAGGTFVQVKLPATATATEVRAALTNPELKSVTVQDVQGGTAGGNEFQIRVQGENTADTGAMADAIKADLKTKFGEGTSDIQRVETVGAKVGSSLWRDATIALILSTLAMGVYIAFRFQPRFGFGAAVALAHDVLVTIGALSLANLEFDLSTVAALLTVVGFSVNDTVIVSDRIRENMRKMTRESLANIVNLSINQTLSRTILTSGTAVMSATALFLLGGPVIRSFSFAILVGFTVGTYSSIFIASPVVLYFEGAGKKTSG
jgi:preprotein translocase subunit SecF